MFIQTVHRHLMQRSMAERKSMDDNQYYYQVRLLSVLLSGKKEKAPLENTRLKKHHHHHDHDHQHNDHHHYDHQKDKLERERGSRGKLILPLEEVMEEEPSLRLILIMMMMTINLKKIYI